MSLLKGLLGLCEKVIFWCLGFLVAGCIFFVGIFYILPVATGIPLDIDKYMSQTHRRMEESRPYTVIPTTPANDPPMVDSIAKEIDRSAENLIRWINQ